MKLNHLNEKAPEVTTQVRYSLIEKIKKLIRKGARDEDSKWASALDLVHQAYKMAEVDRPVPSMEEAWTQYEEVIEFAVEELQVATEKGIRDDSWKTMSTSTKVRGKY